MDLKKADVPLECLEDEIIIKLEPDDEHFDANEYNSTSHQTHNNEILPELIKQESNICETNNIHIKPGYFIEVGTILENNILPVEFIKQEMDDNQKQRKTLKPSSETSDLPSKSKGRSINKLYRCEECDAKFNTPYKLKRHFLIHSGVKPFSCETCGVKFRQAFNLKRHMHIHTGHNQYNCKDCDANFSGAYGLKRHVSMHTVEKPYSCDKCGVKFSQLDYLKKHMRLHNEVKKYGCEECDAKFRDMSGLKRHVLMHTGEKPYSCGTCGAKFSQAVNLKRHMKTHVRAKD